LCAQLRTQCGGLGGDGLGGGSGVEALASVMKSINLEYFPIYDVTLVSIIAYYVLICNNRK
jgi:hypothetical protein